MKALPQQQALRPVRRRLTHQSSHPLHTEADPHFIVDAFLSNSRLAPTMNLPGRPPSRRGRTVGGYVLAALYCTLVAVLFIIAAHQRYTIPAPPIADPD